MVETEVERRLTTLENRQDNIIDWVEEQKEMQQTREAWHRNLTLTLIGFGITIVIGLLAIYFKT